MGIFNNLLDKSPENMVKQAKQAIILCLIICIVTYLLFWTNNDGFWASLGRGICYIIIIPNALSVLVNIGRYFENKKKIEEINKIENEFKEITSDIKHCSFFGAYNENEACFCEKCGKPLN